MINSLFSDVLANAPQPQGGSADWSKTLPMAGAVDWTEVNPFQVINPITGYSFGATQPPAAQPQQEQKAEEPSEYQKWLAQQSTQKTMERSSSDRERTGGLAGNGTNFTDDQWATIKEMNNAYGFWNNPVHQASMQGGLDALDLNPRAFEAQGNAVSAIDIFRKQMAENEALAETERLARAAEQAKQAEQQRIAEQAARDVALNISRGGGTAGLGAVQNAGMSLAQQYASYGGGRSGGGGSDSRGGGFGTGSARTGGDGFGGYSR